MVSALLSKSNTSFFQYFLKKYNENPTKRPSMKAIYNAS